jgi:phosphatidylethanolamine/phosphatidyl-N-methylethanolamine N-methyltransferase
MRKVPGSNLTRRRYDRIAPFYDLLEALIERLRFASWRARLINRIAGNRVLEVGVGTGKNLPYYPRDIRITAVDISPRMLERAQKRASLLGLEVELVEMDAQSLAFPNHVFDTIVSTFVFCSVPNPVLSLQELRRVCKPSGRLLLLEHIRPSNRVLGFLFDMLNPLVVRVVGANINRRTIENIGRAGWRIRVDHRLSSEIVRWIEAEP